MLGHLTFVPSETGASYGDLDVQYLTASYRVYLSEQDARKVFAYIKHLQATSPLWNAETTNCTFFIGEIASFMGLKVPFHLQKPEAYVNELRDMNGGRQRAQLDQYRQHFVRRSFQPSGIAHGRVRPCLVSSNVAFIDRW